MKLLVLGGNVFLGRHVVAAAQAAGHAVTTLTRGRTQPDLHDCERIFADRDGGLGALGGRRWDAVLDTCGYVPRVVAQSTPIPADRYVFVSSVSAYADLSRANTEDDPTQPDVDSEDVPAHYGALKAACERVVLRRDGGIVVRPGLIVGPHDPTGRFTYWPVRLAEGGDVLAPAPADAPVQGIDARDLAAYLVRLATAGAPGVTNAVGDAIPFGEALATIAAAVGGGARLVWRPNPPVAPWSELPWWVGDDPAVAGMMRTSNTKAKAAGLTLRPLADTARDTLAWARTLADAPARQADGRYQIRTLTRAREAELLAAP